MKIWIISVKTLNYTNYAALHFPVIPFFILIDQTISLIYTCAGAEESLFCMAGKACYGLVREHRNEDTID